MGIRINEATCYCHTCRRHFNYLGIARHRKSHLDAGQEARITYTGGETKVHWPKGSPRPVTRDETDS